MRGNMFNEITSPAREAEISAEAEKTMVNEKNIWDIVTKSGAREILECEAAPDAEKVFADFGFSEKEFAQLSARFYEANLPVYESDSPEDDQEEVPEFRDFKKAYMDKDLYHREGSSLVGPGSYAFALGYLRDPRTLDRFDKTPYPGYFSGIKRLDAGYLDAIKEGNARAAKELIAGWIKLDCEKLEKEFFEVDSKDYAPQKGETLIAIFGAPGITDASGDYIWPVGDYQIYRKGTEGLWYYKPGVRPPRKLDNLLNPIEDPENCARGDYSMFLGYYVIRDKAKEAD